MHRVAKVCLTRKISPFFRQRSVNVKIYRPIVTQASLAESITSRYVPTLTSVTPMPAIYETSLMSPC